MFSQLMQRKDCQEYFIIKTMDLINGALSPDNVNRTLDEMNDSRIKEQKNMYQKNLLPEWAKFDRLKERLDAIRTYAVQRAEHIPETLKIRFNLEELYRLAVQPAEGCAVKINSIVTEEIFEGVYFPDFDTVITPILPEGKEFKAWMVNGIEYKQEKLIITPAMVENQMVEVICLLNNE